jgi:hypothetical protein
MKPSLLLACALAALTAASASAAVIVDYKMTASGLGLASAATASPTTTIANVTATALTNQSGGTFVGGDNYNGGTDRVTAWATTTGSTGGFATAFAAGSYVTFQLTVAEGYTMSLSSITFQAAAATTGGSDRSFFLLAETNPANFTASNAILSTANTTAGTLPYQAATATNTIPADYEANLTSFAAIAGGQTVYFRFYLQTPGNSQSIAFDDIVINGTVTASAVPEPSAYALLAGGAFLGFAVCLRRTRRHA